LRPGSSWRERNVRDNRIALVLSVAATAAFAGLAILAAGCSNAQMGVKHDVDATMSPSVQTSAEFDEAVTLITEAKYQDAEAKLNRLLPLYRRVGDGGRTAETLFWLGFCAEKQGRTAEAAQQYREVVKDLPQTPACPHAARRLEALLAPRSPAGGP
jgi:hypothetical protein